MRYDKLVFIYVTSTRTFGTNKRETFTNSMLGAEHIRPDILTEQNRLRVLAKRMVKRVTKIFQCKYRI